MRHSEFEAKIDDYLLGRLGEEDAGRFEDHYFNCSDCFRLTAERAALKAAVRSAGPALASPGSVEEARRGRSKQKSARIPFRWAAAGAMILGLAAIVLFWPRPGPEPVVLTRNGSDVVRGESLTLLTPQGAIPKAPGKFAWNPVAGAAEYTIVVEGVDPKWTVTTRDLFIEVSGENAARFVPGKSYAWQVKAFTAQGIRLATSVKTAFRINR
jgi:hypothetical protein